MIAVLVIVFREVLEAALVVSIVLAATRGVPRRGLWVLAGLALGLAGAGLVALFAEGIASLAEGLGQELFNAGVLFLAVALLSWHNIWMSRHGREMTQHLQTVSQEVSSGERAMGALLLVVALAVLREGSEVVLFLHGLLAGTQQKLLALLGGGALGLLLGAGVGFGLYLGLLRIPVRHLFAVTGGLILLLTAGMAAKGAAYLMQAGLVPPLGYDIWDSSALLSEQSIAGQIASTLLGYMSRPTGIQVLAYAVTLVAVAALMRLARPRPPGAGLA